MYNKKQFIEKLIEFIKSDKKIALIRGYVNEEKLKYVLSVLNQSEYNKGNIQTRSIGQLKDIVDNRIVPKNITQNANYQVENLTLQVNLYERSSISTGDFSIYYPVQSALMNEKDTQKLLNHINENYTDKIFIITTNDWSFTTEKIENIVDEIITLDLKQIDKEKFNILYNNKKGDLPY
ncbi:hypothetical protein [Staphylococcus haemolyticus]|uniref:hypothetical protein n=1 Tax=Staphylococcus haemolyticus TaxID=1283 RepID=UPI001F0AFFF9|nr:hypothetical protein [Staphylococcus haemolyticus]MCH4336571.1 hypothetical protein [Staphylococcus haemolyticus]